MRVQKEGRPFWHKAVWPKSPKSLRCPKNETVPRITFKAALPIAKDEVVLMVVPQEKARPRDAFANAPLHI